MGTKTDTIPRRTMILALGEERGRRMPRIAMREIIREGLPGTALRTVQRLYGLDNRSLGHYLGLDEEEAVTRLLGASRLPFVASDRVWRLLRLWAEATLEAGEEDIRAWFNKPAGRLGGLVPLDLAYTEVGTRFVSEEFDRMEHGLPV